MGHAERMCDRLSIIARGQVHFEGTVDDARRMLPMRAHYVPSSNGDGVSALLPAGAELTGDGWRFAVPLGGAEDIVKKQISAGHGISGLSIERPGLHDAFVQIVSQANAGDVA